MVTNVIKSFGGELEEVKTKEDEPLPYETFIKIFESVITLFKKFVKHNKASQSSIRREFLKDKAFTMYNLYIKECYRQQNVMKSQIIQDLLEKLGVPRSSYNKSLQVFTTSKEHV